MISNLSEINILYTRLTGIEVVMLCRNLLQNQALIWQT